MKRYKQILLRFFGMLLFLKKQPSKTKLQKTKSIGFGIALMSALTVSIGPAVVNAAVSVTKTGTDTTTNSTTQTQSGNTVRWVMSYTHSGSIGTLEFNDAIPNGTQFVPGSLVTPPSFTKSYSQNGGTSYGSADPGTATTNLRAEGVAPATQTAVTSGLAQPPQSFNGAQGGGDGWEAFFTESQLWNFNHHTTSSGLDDRNIQCHDKETGATCDGFPKYANSVAGTPLGTDASDMGFPHIPQGGQYLTSTENKVFLPAHHTSGGVAGTIDSNGILCVDLLSQESCGYTSLFSSTTADLAGGVAIDDKVYLMRENGDVYCMDMPTSTLCAGYPKPSMAGVTADAGSGDFRGGRMMHLESFDERHIFTQVTNSDDGTGNYPHLIGCLDITTGNICSGWNPSKTYASTSSYEAILAPIKDASGTQTGICGAASTGARFACYTMAGAGPTEAPWPEQVAGQNVGWPSPSGYGSILSLGTRLYMQYSPPGGTSVTYTCWDFATNANCAGFTQSSSGSDVRPYTIREDPFAPGCLWETGDVGQFEVFDADTGSFQCSRSAAVVEAAPTAFYCDGLPNHVRSWTTININNITGSQYASAKITLRDANDNIVAGYNDRALTAAEQNSGIIDISAIPVVGNTATLKAQITLFSPDGTPWAGSNDPYLQLTWDGDPIQFCFDTTVTPCSQLTSITNTASFLTADDDAPSGQTDTATATLQSPDSTCEAAVQVKKTVSATTYTPGDTLTYTIQVENTGPIAATNYSLTDDLTAILDDATYNNDAAVTGTGGGSVGYTSPTLTYNNPSLGAGQIATITFTVTTANPGTGNKMLPNKVVSSEGNCTEGSTDPDCSTLTEGPDISVVKAVDKQTFNPGDTVNYTITVTNNGAAAANVNVTDDITQLLDDATYNNNATVTSGTGTAGYTSPTITYTNPTLAAGQSATITFSVTTQSPGTGDKNMPNRVVSNLGNCAQGSTDPQCVTNTVGPNVSITKVADKTTFTPGDTVNYTITVVNNGAAPANVNVGDNLTSILDDATYNNDAAVTGGGSTSYTAPTLTYTNASLGAGQTATITFSVTTTNPGTGDKKLDNKVVSNIGNCIAGSTDPACVFVTDGPNVEVTKTVDKTTYNPGDTINYTITVENTGSAPANVNWSDDLSQVLDDATYNSDAATTGGTVAYSSPNLSYQNSSLAPGVTDTITYSVTTTNPGTGDKILRNTVEANIGNCIEGSTDPACSPTPPAGPDITVVKSVDKTTYNPGDTVNYTITVSNNGAGPANVTATDNLAQVLDDATYNNNAAVTSGGGTVSYAAPTLTYTNPSLGAGQTATFTFSVTTTNPGTGDKRLQNRVVSNLGNCPADSTDPQCFTNTDGPNISFHKTVNTGVAAPGDTLTYTITATNSGNAPASNISYVDNLTQILDDATYNGDAIASGGGSVSYTAPSLTANFATLGAGQTSTITFTATLKNPATGNKDLPNTIVSNIGNCQSGSTDPLCRATTSISDVHIKKEVDKTIFNPGGVVNYTVTAINDGTAAASNITITDDLSEVLDDATYNGDAAVAGGGGGSVSVTSNTLTYTNASLGAGQTATITYSVTTNNPGTGDKEMKNKIQSNYGNCQQGSTDPECVTTSLGPNMVFSKTASTLVTNPGDTLTYTITGTNDGKTAATDVSFIDDLTPLLDDASYNGDAAVITGPGAVAYSSPNLAYTVPTFNVGDTMSITFTVTLKKPATGDKILRNALLSNQGNCQQDSADPRCVTTTNEANVVHQKVADKTNPRIGETVNYTVTVTNNGTAAAANVQLIDDLTKVLDDAEYKDDAVVATGPGSISYEVPELTYEAASLAAGQSATITYSVEINGDITGDLTLDNEIRGYDCTAATPCIHETPIVHPTNLEVTKKAMKPSAYEDKKLEYAVTYSNLPSEKNPEPSDATGAIIRESVPAHTTFVASESDPLWDCHESQTVQPTADPDPDAQATTVYCTANVGTVPAGTSEDLLFVVKVDESFMQKDSDDMVQNRVEITEDCTVVCSLGKNKFALVQTPVGSIEMKKTARTDPIAPGEKLTYTITAKNVGTGPVTDYTITDDFSDVIDDATYNNDPVSNFGSTTYNQPTLTWKGDIPAGQTLTLTYSVTVKPVGSGNGKIVNSVIDPDVISNCMSGSTDPNCKVAMSVSLAKTGDTLLLATYVAGGSILGGIAATAYYGLRIVRRYRQ